MYRKDLYWSVRAVYVLDKLSDVSGLDLGEVGRYTRKSTIVIICHYVEKYIVSVKSVQCIS